MVTAGAHCAYPLLLHIQYLGCCPWFVRKMSIVKDTMCCAYHGFVR